MKAHYICPWHRQNMAQNPEEAEHLWYKLRVMAKHKMDNSRWTEAVTLYGTAYETSAILLVNGLQDETTRVKQFVRSAIEYGFALRKSEFKADMGKYVALVRDQLTPFQHRIDIERHLIPIQDIAYSPTEEVDYWMMLFFDLDHAHTQTCH